MSVARLAMRRPPASLGAFAALRITSSSPVPLRLTLRQARTGPLVLSLSHRCQCQCRFQSTTSNPGKGKGEAQDPRETLTRVLGRALWASFRSLGAPFQGGNIKKLYREHPEDMILALALLAGLAVIVGYAARLYFTYFYSEQFTRYPQPVAKALRRALYYGNYANDPKMALKYYKQALELCDELHLDPFSDDVMGIKIQLAAWLEKIENYDNAAKVLDTLLGDCKRWVEVMEKRAKDGAAQKTLMAPKPKVGDASTLVPAGEAAEIAEVEETLWGKRRRILGKAVGISVKVAELYADEHVRKPDLAHEHLVWAVETAIGEFQRRSTEGVKEGEGDWMTSEQIGATLESLGHSYEAKSQFHLALPLFFRALRLSTDQCHSAVLMNNIATCFAQHPILPPGDAPIEAMMTPEEVSATPAGRRSSYLAAARRWATNAKQHATEPQGEKRTAECDESCAVSLCNLADIANLSGDPAEARRRFEQAIAMSKRIGFAPGVAQAAAGLAVLSKTTTS